jgi:hypothetical protein
MNCGKWYCGSCMDLSHNPPICINCGKLDIPEKKPEQSQPENTNSFERLFNISEKIKTLIKVGLCVFFAVILGFTILFQLKGFSWLFEINYNFLRYIPAFAALLALVGGFVFLRPKSRKASIPAGSITQAQIESLLRTNNKLTPSRLAKATNTSEEYAKKVLDEMVVDGKLEISTAGSYELIYSKNPPP